MSEFSEVIRGRRSVRNFEDKPVPDQALQQVLEAVMWSPSWANTQCWEVVVVKDPARKERLQQTLAKGNPAGKAMTAAPVVLALCGRLGTSGFYKGQVTTKFGDWYMFDLGIACQSICLAAYDQGLGTVVVGLFDHDKTKEILGLPEGCEVVTMIPLGYPSKVPSAPKRRPVSEFSHSESY